jgi:hypothetical protein
MAEDKRNICISEHGESVLLVTNTEHIMTDFLNTYVDCILCDNILYTRDTPREEYAPHELKSEYSQIGKWEIMGKKFRQNLLLQADKYPTWVKLATVEKGVAHVKIEAPFIVDIRALEKMVLRAHGVSRVLLDCKD